MEVPSAYVDFLRAMLPDKTASELYTMVGLQKHGKNLFYRDFLHHLAHSRDRFVVAPGHPRARDERVHAAVVSVRVQGDQGPHRRVEGHRPRRVKQKYALVKHHDRAGRMTDILEYSDVAFPRDRFAPELLAELRARGAVADRGGRATASSCVTCTSSAG